MLQTYELWSQRPPLFSRNHERETFVFKAESFADAVVMPSYRNQGMLSAIDNTAVDNTAIDNTAVDNTAVDN